MAEQFVHVLVTATYGPTEIPIPSRMIAGVVGDLIDSYGENKQRLMGYSMGYPTTPMQCGLKDVWNSMGEEEKQEFIMRYSKLAGAIALMCGDDNGQASSNGNEQGSTAHLRTGEDETRES